MIDDLKVIEKLEKQIKLSLFYKDHTVLKKIRDQLEKNRKIFIHESKHDFSHSLKDWIGIIKNIKEKDNNTLEIEITFLDTDFGRLIYNLTKEKDSFSSEHTTIQRGNIRFFIDGFAKIENSEIKEIYTVNLYVNSNSQY